jgi:hypothetical protein
MLEVRNSFQLLSKKFKPENHDQHLLFQHYRFLLQLTASFWFKARSSLLLTRRPVERKADSGRSWRFMKKTKVWTAAKKCFTDIPNKRELI